MVPQGNTAQVTALTEEVSEALSKQDLEMTAISAGELCSSTLSHLSAACLCKHETHDLVQTHAQPFTKEAH